MDSLAQTDSSETYKRPPQDPDALIENILVPHRVAQVCFRWRAIALRDSTLWNRILINEDSIDRRLSALDIAMRKRRKVRFRRNAFPDTKRMLERSRTQPLHIFIDLNVRDLSPPWEFYQTNIHTLCIETSGMWKHSAILLEVLRGRVLDNLTNLKIDRSYDDWQEFSPRFDAPTYSQQTASVPRSRSCFFPGTPEEPLCPSLRHLNLTGTYHDWDRFVARPTVTQLRAVLEMCSATLETLNLTGALPYLEPEGGMVLPPLTLTRLTQLKLGYTMPVELDAFASNFLVPALTHLSISNRDQRVPGDFDFAEESEIYGDTLNSFTALLASIPFEQLEAFTLRHAQFGSPAPYIATEEMAPAAPKVRLDNPDRFLLMGMLYPQLDMLPKEDDDVLDIPIVLASVKELCFAVDTDDQAHRSIMRYLGDRRERRLVRGENGTETYVGEKIDVLYLIFPLLTQEKEAAVDWRPIVVAKKTFLSLAPDDDDD
ncbi:hypothetical protein BDZ89DRAFT_1137280 [Hymenopellis radicata]|nr:hypothetical protein BDZ89DRAFT_1137280 [Hymenopellis radicata]